MTRRCIGLFIILTLSFLVAPLAAEVQPPGNMHRIGLLGYTNPHTAADLYEAFRRELRTLGWVEGQNLVIEERFAEGQMARAVDIAHEFVTRRVEVIVVPNARTAARVQQITGTLPIVVAGGEISWWRGSSPAWPNRGERHGSAGLPA